jgi:hypothetical protein
MPLALYILIVYPTSTRWWLICWPKHVVVYNKRLLFVCLFVFGAVAQRGPWPPHSRGFLITQRRTAVGMTPLDEWSARRRDLYLAKRNTHDKNTSMPPVGFEPTIPASERPQIYALVRASTGISINRDKGKAIPLQTWTGRRIPGGWGSQISRQSA